MSKVIRKLRLAGQDLEAGARITELLVVTEAKGVDGLSEQWPEGRTVAYTCAHQQDVCGRMVF